MLKSQGKFAIETFEMPDRFIEFIFAIFSRSFRKIGYTKKMSFKIELMQPAVTKKITA